MPLNQNQYAHAMELDAVTDKPMPKVAAQLTGSIVRLSTEPKPTAADGIKDGVMLSIVDVPGEYHIWYKGQWYKQ